MADFRDPSGREDRLLGMDRPITRRDFVGGALVGAGAALLPMTAAKRACAAEIGALEQTIDSPLTGLGPDWTGPGGIGDYARSNGNTHAEVNAGHALRSQDFDVSKARDTGELYDLVIVGGGFAGLSAAYTFRKTRPGRRGLLLENHAIFGGEARQNEFDVDGYRLWGPQGSNGCPWPRAVASELGLSFRFYDELGLPAEWKYQDLEGTQKPLTIPYDIYGPMHMSWERADMGWHFPGHGWSVNPWKDGFKATPIPESRKREYMLMELWRQPAIRHDWERYLDSITYLEFLTGEMGLSADVMELVNPQAACMGCGLGADAISALQAYNFMEPGVVAYKRFHEWGDPTDKAHLVSFPGGNTGIARHFVKKINPKAILGQESLSDILFEPINWAALDNQDSRVRIRLGSTVVNVVHEGSAHNASTVSVVYYKGGELHRVRAKGVVMACGQHVNKHVVKDLPEEYITAMQEFHHASILTVNVALRNWKFMEKLGITAARWFEGFGWYTSLRRQLIIDGKAPMPLDPAKPTVLTLYIPFLNPGMAVPEQAVASRMQMFSMSYAEIERQVRRQFALMFSPAGFDPSRDIAGIVANRQGHAYVVTPPGFFYGKGKKPPPSEVIRRRHGRIAFGHSELQGAQLWIGAAEEGERAVMQLIDQI